MIALLAVATVIAQATAATVIAVRDTSFVSPSIAFTDISLRAMRDGRLYVTDAASALYRVPSDGRGAVEVMRRGEGPGEGLSIRILGWVGDTIVIADPVLARITLVPPKGPVRTSRFADVCLQANPLMLLPDGRCLMGVRRLVNAPPESVPTMVVAGGNRARRQDTLETMDMEHSFLTFRWPDGAVTLRQPFNDDMLVALGGSGDLVAFVERRSPSSEKPSRYRVRIWSSRSGWRRELAPEYVPIRVGPTARDSALKALITVSGRANPTSPVTLDSIQRRLFLPKFWSPVGGVRITKDSLLWVSVRAKGPSPATATAVWAVFDVDGRELLKVALPSGCRLEDAIGEWLWCVERDDDDVPSIARFLVPKSSMN